MLSPRVHGSATLFEDNSWWVTGGADHYENHNHYLTKSTEMFTIEGGFSKYVDLPRPLAYHNIMAINATHAVLLGDFGGGKKYFNIYPVKMCTKCVQMYRKIVGCLAIFPNHERLDQSSPDARIEETMSSWHCRL